MKKMAAALACFCMLLTMLTPLTFAAAEEDGRVIIYVAPDGDDAAAGTEAAPLKTIVAARDKIRSLKKGGTNPEKGFVVYLRGGDYQILEGVEFTAEDSGTETAPVVYRSYPGERAVLVGGASIPGSAFTMVTDRTILNRIIDTNARSQVVVADLHALGISEFGEPSWPGAYSYSKYWLTQPKAKSPELFVNGLLQTLARYPNDGFMTVDEVIDPGAYPRDWEDDHKLTPTYVKPEDRDPTDTFEIRPSDDRYLQWTSVPENEALMYGFWQFDWADETVPMRKVFPAQKKIESGEPGWYSVKKGARFYVFNLLEEIDMPGEYYLDRENGLLYLYPPTNLANADVKFSLMEDDMFTFNGASHVTFRGIKMTAIRSSAVVFNSGSYNEIDDCEIEYTASYGVKVGEAVTHTGVRDSYIHDVDGGVQLYGGDRNTLTPGYNYVIGCDIQNFARITATYTGAIGIGGVGNIIEHNELHDGVHLAISLGGNNHSICYNNIHDVCTVADDMGALYGGRNWDCRGTQVSYNWFHNLHSSAPHGVGIFAIYYDDRMCGQTMIGNVFEDIAGAAIFINGGRDNNVYNNLFIDCEEPVWGYSDYFLRGGQYSDTINHMAALEKVPWQSDVWREAYPELYTILDGNPNLATGNIIENNVALRCPEIKMESAFKANAAVKNNLNLSSLEFYDEAGKLFMITEDSMKTIHNKVPDFIQPPITRMGMYHERATKRVENAVVLEVNSPSAFVNARNSSIDPDNAGVVPVIVNDSTFVPLRFLSEGLGLTVDFDDATSLITISGRGISLELTPGVATIKKSGVETEIKNAPYISEDGRTMVPLRAVSEMFNKQVFWDDRGLIVVSDTENIFNPDADEELVTYLYNTLSLY